MLEFLSVVALIGITIIITMIPSLTIDSLEDIVRKGTGSNLINFIVSLNWHMKKSEYNAEDMNKEAEELRYSINEIRRIAERSRLEIENLKLGKEMHELKTEVQELKDLVESLKLSEEMHEFKDGAESLREELHKLKKTIRDMGCKGLIEDMQKYRP